SPPALADRWITSRLARTIAQTRRALRAYRFNEAAGAVYQFLWHDYCDWYLEWSKPVLYRGDDPGGRARTQATLVEVLETTLRLLHPFMPFITEEIWQRLPRPAGAPESIMIARFPRRGTADAAAEAEFAPLADVVTRIRNIRSEMQIPPGRPLTAVLRPAGEAVERSLRLELGPLAALARAEIRVDPAAVRPPRSAVAVSEAGEVYVPLEGVVDLSAERRRLGREIARAD